MHFRFRFAIGAAALILAAHASAYVYQYDDGSTEDNLSSSGAATFNVLFLTNYTAVAAGPSISSIDIVWGSKLNPNLPNGLVADVLLMSDPNNDGDPNDAAILRSVTTTTTNVGTDTFNNYSFTPLAVTPGTSFFVGAFIHDMPSGSAWVSMDRDAIGMTTKNWWNVAVASPIGADINMSIFGFNDYSFMVRANSPVPEPMTLVALGSGLALMAKRRRNRI